ncbi:MAG: VTT domain-containing protein [Chloroflexota bacterium]|nr:VTT domain-containing protein [Chloroflexota bacterium]
MNSPESSQNGAQQRASQRKLLKIGIVVSLILFTLLIALNRDKLDVGWFRALGYPGVFLMAALGSSTVLLPIPHLAFTFTMGTVLNPWLTGLSAGAGDALGEITGYMAGYAVEDIAGHSSLYAKLEWWMRRNGDLTIFVLSLFPVPFFDLAAMAGGIVGYPLWRFMLATWAGKTIKGILAAWMGSRGIPWFTNLIKMG